MKQLLLLSCVLLFCKHTECVRQILSGIIECVIDRLVFFIDRMRSRIGRIIRLHVVPRPLHLCQSFGDHPL